MADKVIATLPRPNGVLKPQLKEAHFRDFKPIGAEFDMSEELEEEENFDPVMSICTECKTLSWNEEIGVCHTCNYKLHGPNRSFHEDKLKYFRTLLNKKNNWRDSKGGDMKSNDYEDNLKKYSLNPSYAKQVLVIFSSLLNFLSILGYTKVTLNYLYIFELTYAHLGINKHLDEPRISKEKKKFHDDLWLNFLPHLNHILDDKRKREDWRRNVIEVINDNEASEILRQQEWESEYCFD